MYKTKEIKILDIEIIRRVCLARHLYGLAQDYCRSTNDLYLFSSVNLAQDSAEAFLLAIADYVGASIDQRTTFDQYFIQINKKLEPKQLPFKTPLLRLNKIRVNSKHYGIQPARDEVLRLIVSVGEFFSETCTSVLNENFSTLSAIDLLNDSETKNLLNEANKEMAEGKLDKCAIACRKAIYLELENKYDISSFIKGADLKKGLIARALMGQISDAPHYSQNSDYIENNVKCPTDFIVLNHSHLERQLSTYNIDITSFWNIWRLTPAVYQDQEKNWYVKQDFDILDLELLSDKIQYIFDTTINIIFSIHAAKNAIKTQDYKQYQLELSKEETPVYLKADRESEIVGHTPKNLQKVDCDYCINGFKGEGPYWSIRIVEKDLFLAGFIHNDDLVETQDNEVAHNGNIIWFDHMRGFGFINCNEIDKDIFLHKSSIKPNDLENIKPNSDVQFNLKKATKGYSAVNVSISKN